MSRSGVYTSPDLRGSYCPGAPIIIGILTIIGIKDNTELKNKSSRDLITLTTATCLF